MSHVSKVVSLAAALFVFVGGVSLAGPPDPTMPVLAPAPFWFLLPTENAKVPAKTAFNVKLKATNPPPGVYLQWQWKVSGNWQPHFGPTGASWGTSSELVIPVAEGFFQQPGNYRVQATWGPKKSPWRNFQIVPKATIPPVPVPLPSK